MSGKRAVEVSVHQIVRYIFEELVEPTKIVFKILALVILHDTEGTTLLWQCIPTTNHSFMI